jgi:hypothetical protein
MLFPQNPEKPMAISRNSFESWSEKVVSIFGADARNNLKSGDGSFSVTRARHPLGRSGPQLLNTPVTPGNTWAEFTFLDGSDALFKQFRGT